MVQNFMYRTWMPGLPVFLLRFVEVLGEGAYVCEREARISGGLAGYEILKLGKSRDIDLIERVRCGRLLR
jgi:hypothetical protein